jgi:hypothetical protein
MLRKNGTVTWLLTDQVNSTTVTAYADGSFASEVRYSAFGELRLATGVTVTDNKYTPAKPSGAGRRAKARSRNRPGLLRSKIPRSVPET